MQNTDDPVPTMIFIGKEPAIYSVLLTYAGLWNCRLVTCKNEEELSSFSAIDKPVLLIFDISFEMEKDVRTLRQIRALKSFEGVPIAVLSAHSHPDDSALLLKAGADECFTKPIDFDLLRKFLMTRLNRDNSQI